MATFVNYTRWPTQVEGFPMMAPKADLTGAFDESEHGNIDGMPVHDMAFDDTRLPEPSDGVYYVVTPTVAAALSHRGDVLFPIGGRSSDGIVRCKSLGRFRK